MASLTMSHPMPTMLNLRPKRVKKQPARNAAYTPIPLMPSISSSRSSSSSSSSTTTCSGGIKKPMRPLTAYHIFFQIEREYIIQTTAGSDADPSMHNNKTYLQNVPRKYRSIKLLPNWYASPGKRGQKRKHRKSHGKIGFLELSQIISKRWATLDSTDGETKRFVSEIAQRESNVYKREMEEYKVLLSKDIIVGTDDAPEVVVESKKRESSSTSNQKQQKKKQKKKQQAPSSSEQSRMKETGTKILTTTAPAASVVGAMMISPSTSPSPPTTTTLNEASLPPAMQYFAPNNDPTQNNMQYCQQVSYYEHQVHHDFFVSTAIEAADSIAVSPQELLMHHHQQAQEQQQQEEEEEEDKIDYSICKKDEYGHYIPSLSAASCFYPVIDDSVAAVYDPLFELENTTIPTRRRYNDVGSSSKKKSSRHHQNKQGQSQQQQRCVISSSASSSRKRKMRVDVDVSDDDEFWSKLLSY